MASLARCLGGAVIVAVVGAGFQGTPAGAQLELPPLTLAPTDPATTTTTLLPNVLAPGATLLPPAPPPGAPPPNPVLLPTTAAPRRTTSFKPPPIPPSTPVRAPKVAAKPTTRSAPPSGASSAPVDDAELGEGNTGFSENLPFEGAAGLLSADDTIELGIEDSQRGQLGTLASVAAGLIALVLLGIALWLRSEVRQPAPLPPW